MSDLTTALSKRSLLMDGGWRDDRARGLESRRCDERAAWRHYIAKGARAPIPPRPRHPAPPRPLPPRLPPPRRPAAPRLRGLPPARTVWPLAAADRVHDRGACVRRMPALPDLSLSC